MGDWYYAIEPFVYIFVGGIFAVAICTIVYDKLKRRRKCNVK